ncbi:hypothetical protein [Chthoniobacter flavus]|uniref:hypothetical protein n=1 Tax=Chthoniobacter flavus TaxID=191863 RepID=UPI000678F073|nr:hypothetical protein [Chthoniobacter flavus]
MDTPGGRYWAEFEDQAPVTREGQLIFFAQFLRTGGRWEQFVEKSPLAYEGNRGSKVVEVLGTAVLSILCGHWRFMANLVALVYNWWHLYARLHDGAHHREAITSRPALLGGVARLTRHGGQSTVKVSLQHENREALVQSIAQVSNTLHRFHIITERWTIDQRWTLLLTHIFRHWLGGKWLGQLPAEARPLLSG